MKMAASFISDKLKRKASVHKTKSWGYTAPQPPLLTSAVSFHSPEPCQTQQIFVPKCPKKRSARSFTIWNKMQHTASRTHNTMRHFCPPLLSPTPPPPPPLLSDAALHNNDGTLISKHPNAKREHSSQQAAFTVFISAMQTCWNDDCGNMLAKH